MTLTILLPVYQDKEETRILMRYSKYQHWPNTRFVSKKAVEITADLAHIFRNSSIQKYKATSNDKYYCKRISIEAKEYNYIYIII